MTPPPIVTGLSPNEGPPGTKITIRGENFGTKPTDLTGLKVCGCDCLLSAEWKSPNKIIAISGPGKGKGDIIVTTRLGGEGVCNVSFKGYYETVGSLKESAVWVEEAPYFGGKHSLSSSSYQQEDPLGLSVEGNDKKFPEDDLKELFPNASGNIALENFSPGWFLLENHHVTSFNDLKAGLLHLRRKVEGQKEGQLSFLKSNISSVVDQLDTIGSMKDKFRCDLTEYGNEPTLKLDKSIKECERDARKLFDDVLTRRDRAEKTRNALNVLARFRFLFCLPCVIERNIKKGDYEIVINDYMRVKNLFNKSDVAVFKTALNEIEKKVAGLQKMLHQKLVQMPISVEEQKRLIRHLVNLESPYEPAWDAIQSHSEYINLRMRHCYEEHKVAEAIFIEEISKAKGGSSTSKYSKFNQPPQDLSSIPENVLFIEDLCEIVSELFPDLWKLGQAYFTGDLHVKVEPGRQVGFKHIVLSIMEAFCKTLRSAIIPHTLDKSTDKATYGTWSTPDSDTIKPWLPACLRYVRSTYSILIKLDLPSEALDIVFKFILDLRIHCMSVLFKQASDQIEQLSKQETWKIEFTGKHNGVTELPIKFEQSVQEVIQIVRESVLLSEQREGSLLDNPTANKELDKQVDSLLSMFHKVLSNLSLKKDNDDDDECTTVVSQLIGTPTASYRTHNSKSQLPIWEHRLLTTLSNCQYTRLVVLKNLEEGFTKGGYPAPKVALDNCCSKLEALEKSVLELYLEEKSDPLVGTIEPSMYLERFDWDTQIKPTDVRPYVKECINNLIHVHSEVNSISPTLVNSVLPQVVQTISEEIYRLMVCVQKFSKAGILQARVDINTLQHFFQNYSTSKAKYYFKEALDTIPALETSEQLIIEEILKVCKKRMKLQILCLQQPITNGVLK